MNYKILIGDCIESMKQMPDSSVHCCVTSPPYFNQRDYGHKGQIGLEKTPEQFIQTMVNVFREVRRILRDDGTLWLNLGDSYASKPYPSLKIKQKDLIGIPWRVAIALMEDGWYFRQEIIWNKPSPIPESVQDRCTKAHEHIFLMSKTSNYYFDNFPIREPVKPTSGKIQVSNYDKNKGKRVAAGVKTYENVMGANKRDVWTVPTKPFNGAHFATYPPDLILPCILAGTSSYGCCSKCGAPFVRQTSRIKLHRERPNSLTKRTGKKGTGNFCPNDVAGVQITSNGWKQSCKCENIEVVPAVVFDPFFGAGTTGLVSLQQGRNAIGCELNPEYAQIAKDRINKSMGLLLV